MRTVGRLHDLRTRVSLSRQQATVVLLLVAGLFVRSLWLTKRYLWRDEKNVRALVEKFSAVELLWQIPIRQPHLPPYYVFVDLWSQALPFVTARVVSVAAGMIALVASYLVARELLDGEPAVAVLTLLVVSTPYVAAARWVRPYGILCAAAAVSWLALVRGRDHGGRWPVVQLVATIVAVAIHPLGVLVPLGQLVWIISTTEPGQPLSPGEWNGLSWLVPSVVLAPAIPLVGAWVVAKFAGILGSVQQVAHINQLNALWIAVAPGGLFVGRMLWPFQTWLGLLLSGLALLGLRGWRTDPAARLAVCWAVVPFVLAIVASLLHPVFGIKYLSWTAPAWAILIVRGLDRLPGVLGAAVGASALALLQLGLANYLLGAWAGARVALDYLPPLW